MAESVTSRHGTVRRAVQALSPRRWLVLGSPGPVGGEKLGK